MSELGEENGDGDEEENDKIVAIATSETQQQPVGRTVELQSHGQIITETINIQSSGFSISVSRLSSPGQLKNLKGFENSKPHSPGTRSSLKVIEIAEVPTESMKPIDLPLTTMDTGQADRGQGQGQTTLTLDTASKPLTAEEREKAKDEEIKRLREIIKQHEEQIKANSLKKKRKRSQGHTVDHANVADSKVDDMNEKVQNKGKPLGVQKQALKQAPSKKGLQKNETIKIRLKDKADSMDFLKSLWLPMDSNKEKDLLEGNPKLGNMTNGSDEISGSSLPNVTDEFAGDVYEFTNNIQINPYAPGTCSSDNEKEPKEMRKYGRASGKEFQSMLWHSQAPMEEDDDGLHVGQKISYFNQKPDFKQKSPNSLQSIGPSTLSGTVDIADSCFDTNHRSLYSKNEEQGQQSVDQYDSWGKVWKQSGEKPMGQLNQSDDVRQIFDDKSGKPTKQISGFHDHSGTKSNREPQGLVLLTDNVDPRREISNEEYKAQGRQFAERDFSKKQGRELIGQGDPSRHMDEINDKPERKLIDIGDHNRNRNGRTEKQGEELMDEENFRGETEENTDKQGTEQGEQGGQLRDPSDASKKTLDNRTEKQDYDLSLNSKNEEKGRQLIDHTLYKKQNSNPELENLPLPSRQSSQKSDYQSDEEPTEFKRQSSQGESDQESKGDNSISTYSETEEDYIDVQQKSDYLAGLQEIADKQGLTITDVTPDGNCMFHALVDQLRINGNFEYTPSSLRRDAVSFLRKNPHHKDGTHLESFLSTESWENYLYRMSCNTVWGDHMALQACCEVLGCKICVYKPSTNKTVLEPVIGEMKEEREFCLGHVGESHFLSLRPTNWESTWHLHALSRKLSRDAENQSLKMEQLLQAQNKLEKLKGQRQQLMTQKEDSVAESVPMETNETQELGAACPEDVITDDEIGNMFESLYDFSKGGLEMVMDRYAIDRTSSLPLPHLNTIIQNIIRPTYLDNQGHRKEFDVKFSESFSVRPVGSVSDELTYRFKNFRYDVRGYSAPMFPTCIAIWDNVRVHRQTSEDDAGNMAAIADSTLCRPGYLHLHPVDVTLWKMLNQLSILEGKYFVHHVRFDMKGDAQSRKIKLLSGFKCAEWPELSLEWATRDRLVAWPPADMITKILQTDCIVMSRPHPDCFMFSIEWQYVFPDAEEILSKECLTCDQRYCFSVFCVLVNFHIRSVSDKLRPIHLKAVFFYACEEIDFTYWTANIAGCILFLLDKLLYCIKQRNLPNYFIKENNMIDHIPDRELSEIYLKLQFIRMFPVVSLIFLTEEHGIYLSWLADEVMENVQQYVNDGDIRHCVKHVLAPAVLNLAKFFFNHNFTRRAFQAVKRAYKEFQTYLKTDDIPDFKDFVLHFLQSESDEIQYMVSQQMDYQMNGTHFMQRFIDSGKTITTLQNIVGKQAGQYANKPVPKSIAGDATAEIQFLDEFARQLFNQNKWEDCARMLHCAIHKAREGARDVIDTSDVEDERAKADIIRHNNSAMMSFNRLKLNCFSHLHICYQTTGEFHFLGEIIEEYEADFLCNPTACKNHIGVIESIWYSLGFPEKAREFHAKLKSFN